MFGVKKATFTKFNCMLTVPLAVNTSQDAIMHGFCFEGIVAGAVVVVELRSQQGVAFFLLLIF